MTQAEVENRVIGLFRRCALVGNPRPAPLVEPLGEQGSGSLRLIAFTLAFKKEFGLVSPDDIWDIWGQSRRLTLGELAQIVFKSQMRPDHPSAPVSTPATAPHRTPITDAPQSSTQNRGKGRGALFALFNIFRKMLHQVYRREIFNVLSFDLRNRAIPSPRIAEAVTIRLLTPDDAAQFLELWREKRAMKSKRFRQRMENGYVATGIWSEGRLVGVNWFTGNCDYDSLTGLWIKLAPRSCYALDLQEHEDFQGHRIGLATLAQSLREAKALGFDLQFICVSEYNERMLAGAKYLLGYKKVGEIKTAYWFRRPRSRWSVSGQQGRGGTLVLGG